MSHTGIVDVVFGASVPDTNVPALKIIVNGAKSDLQPEGKMPALEPFQPQVAFFIPKGPAPAAGDTITWDAHHASWRDQRVAKLTWELEP